MKGARALRRLLLLACLPTLACGDSATEPADSYAGRFQELWERYDVTYPYFVHKAIDWDGARDTYFPRALAANSQDELVAVLTEMLGKLHDVHVWFVRPDGTSQGTYTSPRPRNWDRTTWQEYIARTGWHQGSGTSWGWGRFGDIAYLTIGDWNGDHVTTAGLDTALDSLRGSAAMVIDVRMNPGGNDAIALDFASRFTAAAVTTELIRYRGGPRHDDFTAPVARRLSPRGPWTYGAPVFLLIGRGVYSSNESFVAAMRELPQVRIVGDTTGGGSGNPGFFPLGDDWQYTVPRWFATTVDGIVIEDNGIPPDVAIPVDLAGLGRRVDVVLDSALALARAARRAPLNP